MEVFLFILTPEEDSDTETENIETENTEKET